MFTEDSIFLGIVRCTHMQWISYEDAPRIAVPAQIQMEF